jgi:EamA domain-containing membrane protein RarD
MTRTQKGLAAAICSNLLFAALFLYSSWMQPMSGTDVFMWRMVAMLFGLLALLSLSPQLAANGCFCPKPRQKPQALAVALTAHAYSGQPAVAFYVGAG